MSQEGPADAAAMTEAQPPAPLPDLFTELRPFLWISLGWLVVSLFLVVRWNAGEVFLAIEWTVGLWTLCLLDLLALARAVAGLLQYLGTEGEKRIPLLIHASYWGLLKLACLGIFTVVLFRGRTIPSSAILLGTATLVVVPLIGGFWWSRRAIQE